VFLKTDKKSMTEAIYKRSNIPYPGTIELTMKNNAHIKHLSLSIPLEIAVRKAQGTATTSKTQSANRLPRTHGSSPLIFHTPKQTYKKGMGHRPPIPLHLEVPRLKRSKENGAMERNSQHRFGWRAYTRIMFMAISNSSW
jgi:hypothetical protein